MKNTKSFSVIAVTTLASFMLAGALLASETPKKSRVAVPQFKIEQGGQCVEPTDEMRRNHMEKILHQRDRTVHEGIRTTQHSLKNCINCHASKDTGSVLGKNGFCESCHTYAAVTLDCFSCHSDKREPDTKKTGELKNDNRLAKTIEKVARKTP
jgi:hypothetical protein